MPAVERKIMAKNKSSAKESDNSVWKRHRRIYAPVMFLIHGWIEKKFNFTYEDFDPNSIEGPMIVIPNHSCSWDPLLMLAAFRKRQMYFVASEHVLRMRLAGPILNFIGAPIPRRKASSGTAAVKSCLRHLRDGHSICLFAEGEQTWDGVSREVFPGTGKLVKQSGATLVTYRLEGAYLSLPRWARGVRKGKVFGRPAGVYPPEVLKGMKPDEINDLINRDLDYDVWKWQDEQSGGPVRFVCGKGAEPAGHLDKALFACPVCGAVGNLTAGGSEIGCSCGFRAEYTETGFFEPPEPFRTIAEWDRYDRARLEELMQSALGREASEKLFSDSCAELSLVEEGHRDHVILSGEISLSAGDGRAVLKIGDFAADLGDITMMAPVLSDLLLFSLDGSYYQIRTENTNLRKYNMAWEYIERNK